MNIWPYVGLFAICCIGFLLFTLVTVWAFVCVDNYFADKKEKEEDEGKIATCAGCKYLCDDGMNETCCLVGVSESSLRAFNQKNIRPCYCKEEEK